RSPAEQRGAEDRRAGRPLRLRRDYGRRLRRAGGSIASRTRARRHRLRRGAVGDRRRARGADVRAVEAEFGVSPRNARAGACGARRLRCDDRDGQAWCEGRLTLNTETTERTEYFFSVSSVSSVFNVLVRR